MNVDRNRALHFDQKRVNLSKLLVDKILNYKSLRNLRRQAFKM
jgi:hypothetical protein